MQGALRTRLAAFLGFFGPTAPEDHEQAHSAVQPATAASLPAAQPRDLATPSDGGVPAAGGGSSPGELLGTSPPATSEMFWTTAEIVLQTTIMTCSLLALKGRDALCTDEPALQTEQCFLWPQ